MATHHRTLEKGVLMSRSQLITLGLILTVGAIGLGVAISLLIVERPLTMSSSDDEMEIKVGGFLPATLFVLVEHSNGSYSVHIEEQKVSFTLTGDEVAVRVTCLKGGLEGARSRFSDQEAMLPYVGVHPQASYRPMKALANCY